MRLRLRLSLVTAAAILGIAATIYGWPYVRASIRSTTTSSQGAPIEHATPGVDTTIHRLAYLADAPEPDVHLHETDRPESVTVGTVEDASPIVSSGVLDRLSDEELEAVLAHEVSHLANGDSRVMGPKLRRFWRPTSGSRTTPTAPPTTS